MRATRKVPLVRPGGDFFPRRIRRIEVPSAESPDGTSILCCHVRPLELVQVFPVPMYVESRELTFSSSGKEPL